MIVVAWFHMSVKTVTTDRMELNHIWPNNHFEMAINMHNYIYSILAYKTFCKCPAFVSPSVQMHFNGQLKRKNLWKHRSNLDQIVNLSWIIFRASRLYNCPTNTNIIIYLLFSKYFSYEQKGFIVSLRWRTAI